MICARIESEKRVGDKGAGWLHKLRDDCLPQKRTRHISIAPAPDPKIMFSALADRFSSAISENHLQMLSSKLGVTVKSLEALKVGYSFQHRAYTFPMQANRGDIRGIRLRTDDGRKFSIKGGREGLFIPKGVGPADPFGGGGQLLICEGPTDCAALFDLDFNAVGRPSCNGGVQLLVDLISDWHPDDVTILADADAPGLRGAKYLASRLVGFVPSGVRIVTPPAGAKDARDWAQLMKDSAISFEDARLEIQESIEAAPLLKLTYGVKAVSL